MMARDGLDILRPFDAIFFGAVGFPTVPDHVSLRGLRLPICQGFEQYVCYRPSVLLPGVRSPLAGKRPGDIDFVVVRENTEGEYAGAGGRSHQGLPIEVAVQTAVFTRVGIERVVRYAFQLARRPPPEARERDQVERAAARDDALGRGGRGREPGVPRRRDGARADRRAGRALRPRPRVARRGRGQQPVRRHPHRPRRGDLRQHGPRPERQHQPGAGVPVHVRAGARLRAGHRGQGHRQPRRPDRERRDDARVPRREGGGGPHRRRRSAPCWPRGGR